MSSGPNIPDAQRKRKRHNVTLHPAVASEIERRVVAALERGEPKAAANASHIIERAILDTAPAARADAIRKALAK